MQIKAMIYTIFASFEKYLHRNKIFNRFIVFMKSLYDDFIEEPNSVHD